MTALLAALALLSPQGGAPTVAAPAAQEEKKYAKLIICESVDDDWKPVGAAKVVGEAKNLEFEWPADKKYNILIDNRPNIFAANFLGIILHKQGADGKDTDFIDEFMTDQLDEKVAKMWCTVDGLPNHSRLAAGRYTIYVIRWDKRQVNYHPGNFTDYYARITLHVK